MSLPLQLRTEVIGLAGHRLLKAVDGEVFAVGGWAPDRSVLLLDRVPQLHRSRLMEAPWAAIMTSTPESVPQGRAFIRHPQPAEAVAPGDVIDVSPGRPTLRVVYRRGQVGNILFTTERCNSFCLMCSQPPREVADSWRVESNLELLSLIDRDEPHLTITGGEPTLLGDDLRRLIDACGQQLPATALQVLTNGRRFNDPSFAAGLKDLRHPSLLWGIPLYADVAPLHDYVVQSRGAFAETLAGLYQLATVGQRIEIRVVLVRPTIARLPALARFIVRNLSFVQHVALMGLEPTGFFRANSDALWIDPADYQQPLEEAMDILLGFGLRASIYNLPLCNLPKPLWPFAQQSISTWKNRYLDRCEPCSMKGRCAGFFESVTEEWVSRAVAPISGDIAHAVQPEAPV